MSRIVQVGEADTQRVLAEVEICYISVVHG